MAFRSVARATSGRIGAAALIASIPLTLAGETFAQAPAALAAIEGVAQRFADEYAVEGGYVWAYAPDNTARRGEGGEVAQDVIWLQPPGTQAIGGVYLSLYERTGEERWLEAARATAQALVRTQLLSGGWFNFAETDPAARSRWCYRSEVSSGDACKRIEGNELKNRSSLDDNITQSALGFLLWLTRSTDDPGPGVGDALEFAFRQLKAAQFSNGAWPVHLNQDFASAAIPASAKGRFPDNWSREWVKPNRGPYMLTNDHVQRDVVRVLLAAFDEFGDPTLLQAACRTGDFLLAAQLPDPQRGWAQMYDSDLEPVWGRSFEPPAVASRETAGVIEALVQLYLRTDDRRYLQGAIEAAEWLRKSRRKEGDWARFYELRTNVPLFVDSHERLMYDPSDMLHNYGLLGEFGIENAIALVDAVKAGEETDAFRGWNWVFQPTPPVADDEDLLRRLVEADGAPVEENGWIWSSTLVNAVLAYDRLVPAE